VDAVAAAASAGTLHVDGELHEVQLPEAVLEVDAQVRFSWIMLGREPHSATELRMTYAGILAHGTSLTAGRMRSHDPSAVCGGRPSSHALGGRRAATSPRVSSGARVHAESSDCRDLGSS
jgi:hypothetical protein